MLKKASDWSGCYLATDEEECPEPRRQLTGPQHFWEFLFFFSEKKDPTDGKWFEKDPMFLCNQVLFMLKQNWSTILCSWHTGSFAPLPQLRSLITVHVTTDKWFTIVASGSRNYYSYRPEWLPALVWPAVPCPPVSCAQCCLPPARQHKQPQTRGRHPSSIHYSQTSQMIKVENKGLLAPFHSQLLKLENWTEDRDRQQFTVC